MINACGPFGRLDWLLNHHKVKELERRRIVADIGLRSGERVLDVGCGPGLWASLFFEHVAPDGMVTGIDSDELLLRYAIEQKYKHPDANRFHFYQGDFRNLPHKNDYFDLVFCGNALQLLEEPTEALCEFVRVTKPGGRIVDKSYDGSLLLFHPVDPVLLHRVLWASARGLSENPDRWVRDNFFGRRNRGLFQRLGLLGLRTQAYALDKYWPLTDADRRYITVNAMWYLETGRDQLTVTEIAAWEACFDAASPDCILDREDFYFCTVEVMTTGCVPVP